MYKKNKESPKMKLFDRDSGFVTEAESDVDMSHRPGYIFSDDDEEVNQILHTLGDIHHTPQLYQSPTFYTNLADQAVVSVRHHLVHKDWKKVLKHKSGVTVYMLSNSQEKTALFRGESVIKGFTPQSIFYVVGMRKLWDDQFDEGKLIENLNDTTSLTYESYKSTTTSKAYDLTLVEKIECSTEGEILFVCSSVDTPQVPKQPGKNRHQVKLQGWILQQLNTQPVSTKVTYITQENIKGWIPGLTKKSLARKPLIIASIDTYLKKKSDRSLRSSNSTTTTLSTAITPSTPLNNNDTASSLSLNTNRLSPPSILLQHSNNSSVSSYSPSSPILGPNDIMQQKTTVILSNPPPRISSLVSKASSTTTKHITFADDLRRSPSPMSTSAYSSSGTSSARSSYNKEEELEAQDTITEIATIPIVNKSFSSLSPIHEIAPGLPNKAIAGSKLYPASRHRVARKQCMDQLKAFATSSLDQWKLVSDRNKTTKIYTQEHDSTTLPVMRSESILDGQWTPEQICSVVQCFGARKTWDDHFDHGQVMERFSQKEYLIYTQMKSIFPITGRDFSMLTCIESNVSTGAVYIASTSVKDELIPVETLHTRGSYLIYGWIFEPLKNAQKLIGVKVTMIAHLDMGGTTPLPSSIIRLLTNEMPLCIDRIQSYLAHFGCPPYIRRVAGKITLETFDDGEYRIEYIAKHAPSARQYKSRHSHLIMWCTDIRTHTSMYPSGYHITTAQEGIRVELRSDCLGFRVYTEKEEMDSRVVQVLLKPAEPNEKPVYTWNGSNLIEEEVVDIKKKKELRRNTALISDATPVISDNIMEELEDHIKNEQTIVEKEPSSSFEHLRRNSSSSHVFILSDELSFTGQQFGFIILLMATCYYFGKFSCNCSL